MRLMELEMLGFGMQSSLCPDNDHVIENLKKALVKLDGHLEKYCLTGFNILDWVPQFIDVEIKKLYDQLLHVRSSYHNLIVSWIGENMPKYQQLWDGLMTKTFKSLKMALGHYQRNISLSDVAIHHRAASIILRILICYKMSSSFRVFFYQKSFSAEQMQICLGMLRQAVEPFTLYFIPERAESRSYQRDFKFTNSREILFMESVIHSREILFMDENEIQSDLLADIEVVLSKASEAIVNWLASGSHNSEPVNTAVRFISIVIYSQVRLIEETEAPSQNQKGGPSLSMIDEIGEFRASNILESMSQHQKGGKNLSWIDEIGVKFWDCILENMLEILKQGSCQLVQRKKKKERLATQLRFMKYFLTGPPMGFSRKGNWNNFSETIKVTIIRQVTYMFLSCYYDKFPKQAKKLVIENIRLIYSFERENFSHCPSTDDDLESLCDLSGKMEILIRHIMISSLRKRKKRKLEKAQEELTFLIDSLSKISNERIEYDELNFLCWQIGDVACAMYFIAQSLLDGRCPNLYLKLWFSDFEKDTRLIRQNIDSISEKNRSTNHGHDVTTLSNYKSPNGTDPIINEEIVGFVDEEIKVVEHIVRGPEDMAVVLITGMAGLGKTTLAKKVFNNQTVAEHFYVRSWCCVSHGYQRKDLIVQILKHIKPLGEDMDEDRLAGILRKELMQRRYLIIMDDIWDITAWHDLRSCFPDDKNGSRILLTSRFNELPLQSETKIHFLNPLSDDESWELLQKKLCLTENSPPEHLEIGNKVARGCKGVPLVVVLVAGLLADMNLDQWQKIACNVTLSVVNDSQRQCADILEISYKNLPYYLKPCFLYFGGFPPDSEISSKKLAQLWVAEGFIKRRITNNVECIAEGYLIDLVQRNLIQVAERRSLGSIKTCRVHDLIHDFCSSKGEEENFVQRITDASGAASKQTLRLSILYDWDHDSVDWSSYMNVCSLSFYSNIQNNSAKYIFEKFRLLRVLDLMTPILMWDIIDLPDAIGLLVHLRFLAGPFSSIPSSVGNLTYLVTFRMVVLQTDVIEFPSSFYSLVRLRHLHISCASIFNPHHFEVSDPVSPFYSLQTLSTLLLPEYGDSVLTLFPSLRKLKCLFVNRLQRVTYPQFDLLTQLESLEMTYLLGDWDETVPRCHENWNFSFPPSIRKLTLKMFCLPWSQMSVIEKLPNLEVLKLDRSAFVGKEWNVEDGMFRKLKYLRLRGLNIVRWSASADNFPRLENLVVQGCKYLEEIPAEFANIPTLKAIEVSGCKLSVEASAKEIYEEQMEYGNEELKILARDNDPNKAYIWSGTVRRRLASEISEFDSAKSYEYSHEPCQIV